MPELQQLLDRRRELTTAVSDDAPYLLFYHYLRSQVHAELGYPDLAVMDAYKALLLVDEVLDESGEYHEQAKSELEDFLTPIISAKLPEHPSSQPEFQALETEIKEYTRKGLDTDAIVVAFGDKARKMLVHNLTTIGCLRSAYVFVQQIQKHNGQTAEAAPEIERFLATTRKYFEEKGQDPHKAASAEVLPDRGLVRREIYPWNLHEEDRNSADALKLLNEQMANVSSKFEVKVVELPALNNDASSQPAQATVKQLGVFAQEDIMPGEEVLRERSLLTANARFHDPLCDACSAELPGLGALKSENAEGPASCQECDDIVFCSQTCHDLAQDSYHPAVCGMDVESIAKEVPAAEAADALYTLLLLRSLAMAQTQEVHPLDLQEVKYIWGDFTSPPPFVPDTSLSALENGDAHFLKCERTLPFSFSANVLLPLHMLEKMDLNIFEPLASSSSNSLELSEAWVFSTLYAKFRGTASGRVNPRDGRPEVAAVHPLWCLANHSCDPNVQWEWAGEIKFTCREKRAAWARKEADGTITQGKAERGGGISKGEEILNHYVDIELPVKERREWGSGALGGNCMCERCAWEAGR